MINRRGQGEIGTAAEIFESNDGEAEDMIR